MTDQQRYETAGALRNAAADKSLPRQTRETARRRANELWPKAMGRPARPVKVKA